MGVSTVSRIVALTKSGVIEPAATFRYGAPRLLLSDEQLDRIRGLKPRGYGSGEGLILGLQRSAKPVFRRVLSPTTWQDHFGRTAMDLDGVRALLAALEARARPIDEASGPLINLATRAFWQARYEPALSAVLAELTSGTLPVFKDAESVGFRRFNVCARTVVQLEGFSRVRTRVRDDRQSVLFGAGAEATEGASRRTQYWKPMTMKRRHADCPVQLQLGI